MQRRVDCLAIHRSGTLVTYLATCTTCHEDKPQQLERLPPRSSTTPDIAVAATASDAYRAGVSMVSLNYPVVTCGAECWLGTLSAVLRMPLLRVTALSAPEVARGLLTVPGMVALMLLNGNSPLRGLPAPVRSRAEVPRTTTASVRLTASRLVAVRSAVALITHVSRHLKCRCHEINDKMTVLLH